MSLTKEEARQETADRVAEWAYSSFDDASLEELMRHGEQFEKLHPEDEWASYMNRALQKIADKRERMRQQTRGGDR
jgi:hypothetical protein